MVGTGDIVCEKPETKLPYDSLEAIFKEINNNTDNNNNTNKYM